MSEQEFLKKTRQELSEDLEQTKERIGREKEEVLRLKQYLYEASASDMDEAEIRSNMQSINECVAMTDLDIRRMDILEWQLKNPYFGKLSFRFDEDGEILPVYVGIHGYWSDRKEDQIIFDWRAPVCSLFYDYEKGAACYRAPMGDITGDILEKKQISITDGELEYVLDTDSVINDEILIGELNKNSSQKMRTVAATIQKQQNAIIRNNTAETLVVDGRAGSGKTVIALHRVAWLLYNNRKTLKAENVMILSPNGVFSDYISGILPELGEDAAPEKEWDDLMAEILFVDADYETKMEQADYILSSADMNETRIRNIRYKSSIEFYEKFLVYLDRYVEQEIHFTDFHFEKMTFPKERTEILFHTTFRQYAPYERFLHVASFIVDEMEESTGKQFGGGKRERILKTIQKEMVIRFAERNIVSIYQNFLEEEEKSHPGVKECFNEEGKICYEDILPVMYLQVALYGCDLYRGMKHLVVDEMQDYTIFQYAALEKIFPCKKTILGDKYQVLFYNEQETVLDVLKRIFPKQEQAVLKTAYRSTREITEFCNRILGITETASCAREGKVPEVRTVNDRKELTENLMEILSSEDLKKYENIAVLTDDEKTAGELYAELRDGLELTIVSENSAVYFGGIVILPKFFAKGMEFDVVCVVNEKKRTDNVVALHEYYISCTRALHELYVLEMTEAAQ